MGSNGGDLIKRGDDQIQEKGVKRQSGHDEKGAIMGSGPTNLLSLKLPSSVRMESDCFNEDKYKVEGMIKFTNDTGKEQTYICPVDNIVRWRFTPEDEKATSGPTINSVISKE